LSALREYLGFFAKIPRSVLLALRSFLCLALCASAAVLAGELLINTIYFDDFSLLFASALAVFGNILILFCLFLIILVAVNRKFVAIVLGTTLYGIIVLADILKLRSFDNPVRPMDLQYLPDLKVIAMASLGFASITETLVAVSAIVAAILLLWK